MLTAKYAAILDRILLPPRTYAPFPSIDRREAWNGLPADIRANVVEAGEQHLGHAYPPLTATAYLEFLRRGDRAAYEGPYFERRRALTALAAAECVEAEGRFLDDIANGVWTICEESSWVVPAHNYERLGEFRESLPDFRRRRIDLFAAETGALLALVHRLLGERLAGRLPVVPVRIEHEVRRRILDPYLEQDDFWWMWVRPAPTHHVNNWTPWCTSTCLLAFALLEGDPARLQSAVGKALASLDVFLGSYADDGGCDEGTSYWSRAAGSLLECLDTLGGLTGGAIDVWAEPRIANMGRFLYRMHVCGRWFVNFADASATQDPPLEIVHSYGRRIGDGAMRALAARRAIGALPADSPGYSLARLMRAIFAWEDIRADSRVAADPLPAGSWFEGIQVMTARQRAGSCEGLSMAAKGGHNDESHNHNDVGSFVVYLDGEPLIVDVGVPTYTSRTFDPEHRYEQWPMQSAFHNLPTIGGRQQAAGPAYRAADVAWRDDGERTQLSLDIAAAYPADAGCRSWRRILRLDRRAGRVEVLDQFTLARATADIAWSLMTACEHEPAGPGRVILQTPAGASATMRFDSEHFAFASETIPLDDPRLEAVWGGRLHRLLLRSRRELDRGEWRLALER